jgi:effector-binding domain-containing protein
MADFETRRLEPRPTISVRLETTQGELAAMFDRELPRVGARLAEVGATMAGPPFARYHHFGPDRVDVEVGAPIEAVPPALEPASGRPDGVIGASSLPGGEVGVLVHEGSYDGLAGTYDRLHDAIEAAGLAHGDGPWEVYLTDPQRVPDPADWRTEVVWPLA